MSKIKFYREKSNITVRQLSEKANVSFGHISDLENGISNNPSKETMTRIAGALELSVQDVFFSEEKEGTDE